LVERDSLPMIFPGSPQNNLFAADTRNWGYVVVVVDDQRSNRNQISQLREPPKSSAGDLVWQY
jgi:hypothetical protein